MWTRRDFLWNSGGGLGGIALAHILGHDQLLADAPVPRADLNGGVHHRARAKRVVQFFMSGAASQCDLFDYKPELIRRHGEPFNPGGRVELFQSSPGPCMKSPFQWTQHGECGKWMSSVVPNLARCVDDICFLPAMVARSNVHGPATFMQNTGFVLPGFPSMGAWINYGLGSMTQDLPAFVVMPDSRGFGPNGPANWSSGFLPANHQGTILRPNDPNPIFDLFPTANNFISPESERDGQALLRQLNERHLRNRPGDSRLEARIASYELAVRLQLSAPEVLDIASETQETQRLYGLDHDNTREFGRNCLIARRLFERGTRFVQIWSGADNGFPRRNWDSHEDLGRDHRDMSLSMEKGCAGLIQDLKRRGLLDDTIVMWTTEFGRMPCSQGGLGRDHNPFTFTSWLAGGGIKGGTTYGASDEWSFRAAENVTTCYDVHATILHQLGIDHTRLTFRHNGIDRRLTDVHGHVINEIIA